MKKNTFIKIIISLIFNIGMFTGCNSDYQKKNFDELMIKSGKKEWRTIEFSEQMYNDTAFTEVYNHSKFYYYDVISFLKTEKFEDTLKYSPVCITKCIWAMQNLPLKQYIGFCDTIFTLFKSGKIANVEMFEAISPNFGRKYIYRDNYKNVDVVNLLNRIKSDQKISSNLRNEVDEILAGKYK
ncbi:hypothetical protein [Ferruginibacter profundus]